MLFVERIEAYMNLWVGSKPIAPGCPPTLTVSTSLSEPSAGFNL